MIDVSRIKMAGKIALSLAIIGALVACGQAQHDPHFVGNRTTMVHLFEWRWTDIAQECERFLGPQGYGGIQVSPPNENAVINYGSGNLQRPWYERYQPVSYNLETRSGTEQQFQDMVRRCNAVGVRVYVDAVINHMTGGLGKGVGTGGSQFDSEALHYPGVPFSNSDFHAKGSGAGECPSGSGDIESYSDVNQVRNCRLVGLKDLHQTKDYVRGKIADFLNKLVSYGVAGFRVDAAKHMWPGDMKAILNKLNDLPTSHGFPAGSRPFVVQEVIDLGGEAISAKEYYDIGRVTEFKLCAEIGNVFRKQNGQILKYLQNWGTGWGFMPDRYAFTFIDNHDNQRGHGAGGRSILTFRDSKLYKMATAFNLAWNYGVTRVMSSFFWEQNWQDGKDQNDWVGPPHDANFNTLPVSVNPDNTCGNGWVCEHRWRQIYNMVAFRNEIAGTTVNNWWDNTGNQIAFSRGNKGFIAINNDNTPMGAWIQTSLPGGKYCDVITGNKVGNSCTGKVIEIENDGVIYVSISNLDADPMIAVHAGSKL